MKPDAEKVEKWGKIFFFCNPLDLSIKFSKLYLIGLKTYKIV